MKIYLFVITLSLISCKNAIKNEVKSDLMASNEITSNEITSNKSVNKRIIVNNSKVINSKEDLLGTWRGEALGTEVAIYTSKFVFLFDEVKGDFIKGRILYSDEIIPFQTKIIQKGKFFEITWKNRSKKDMVQNCSIKIARGNKKIEGTIFLNPYQDYEFPQKPEKHTIELEKAVFEYGIDNVAQDSFVDSKKEGKGYRVYTHIDSTGNKIEQKEERDGYFATTGELLKINPSVKILSKENVENLTKADLYILIQLVYAKHGLIFKDKKLSEYFLNHSWYIPVSNNVDSDLTEIEKKNIDLLGRYERNAKEYYAVFGR